MLGMIKALFLSIMFFAHFISPSSALGLDCSSATTQQERDICSGQVQPATAAVQPNAETTNTQAVGKTPEQERINLILKIVAVVAVLICIVSIYLHHNGTLIIYSDYTDAAFTSLTLPIILIIYFVLQWLEVPKLYSNYGAAGLGGLMILQVIRSTITANGFGIRALMALITKICMVVAFYIILALCFARSSGKRQGESQSAYERRSRREQREAQASAAATTAIYTGLTAWLCRNSGFSSLGDYLSGHTD